MRRIRSSVKLQNSPAAAADYSGMYSFLRDGEFVQLTVEDQGHVIGFVSRYAGSEAMRVSRSFFEVGKARWQPTRFTSETVHGVSFEFRGTVERGEGKSRSDEAYYVLKGTLWSRTLPTKPRKLLPAARGCAKKFPAGFGSTAAGKEVDCQSSC
jgi:hypothetical protein